MTTRDIKTYTELMSFNTFAERLAYLKLDGIVGQQTFGDKRYLNQRFYRSRYWRDIRDYVIIRDSSCDLAIPEMDISEPIIHHMNPVLVEDIVNDTDYLTNPDYLICVSAFTHRQIHYGMESDISSICATRSHDDTCPWRRIGGDTS